MKSAILPNAFLIALALLGGSGAQAAERLLYPTRFDQLIVDGDIEVKFETGPSYSAKANGDAEKIQLIKLEQYGSTIKISIQGPMANMPWKGARPVVTLVAPNLVRLTASGNGAISLSAIETPYAYVELRGSGIIDIGKITADRLEMLLLGDGSLSVAGGTVKEGIFAVDGAGKVETASMAVAELQIMQNGTAQSHLTVSNDAHINNSGKGSITIDGSAICHVQSAGGGKISCQSATK